MDFPYFSFCSRNSSPCPVDLILFSPLLPRCLSLLHWIIIIVRINRAFRCHRVLESLIWERSVRLILVIVTVTVAVAVVVWRVGVPVVRRSSVRHVLRWLPLLRLRFQSLRSSPVLVVMFLRMFLTFRITLLIFLYAFSSFATLSMYNYTSSYFPLILLSFVLCW